MSSFLLCSLGKTLKDTQPGLAPPLLICPFPLVNPSDIYLLPFLLCSPGENSKACSFFILLSSCSWLGNISKMDFALALTNYVHQSQIRTNNFSLLSITFLAHQSLYMNLHFCLPSCFAAFGKHCMAFCLHSRRWAQLSYLYFSLTFAWVLSDLIQIEWLQECHCFPFCFAALGKFWCLALWLLQFYY